MFATSRLERAGFAAKRSVVMACNGIVATSQPLAAEAGVTILKKGGNAFDAAIATALTLDVVEPMSTGIGGDAFLLYRWAADGKIYGVNGSGRCPQRLTLDALRRQGIRGVPQRGWGSVSVPGGIDAFYEVQRRHGKLTFAEVLEPAMYYASEGFPVSEVIATQWQEAVPLLSRFPASAETYLVHGQAPRAGDVHRQPNLARTLQMLASEGKDAFYRGDIARRIVECARATGGYLEMEDFAAHSTEWVEPLRTDYRGHTVLELPPNGQGITALIALNILEGCNIGAMEYGSAAYYHVLIEATKQAFADRSRYIADPAHANLPVAGLLSKDYAAARRQELTLDRASDYTPGDPTAFGNTVYVTCVDRERNAVSLIHSLFMGFGSGVVAGDTGICLQNRGAGFVADPHHVNALAPGKRPFHTIIPAMILQDEQPWLCYGVMGGDMQPQGHLQVALNMIDFGMNVQEAIEAPRYRIMGGKHVALERAIAADVRTTLTAMGHILEPYGDQSISYGGGQGILIDAERGVLQGGSDYRKDGCAIGY
ncbi:MAG: gamma-glutamyltransferase [Candidatus Tectomicrobia bacterium]|uniref:Glutathione hydrolase proenzyme n=1 Tax=Tectimicrobiota bacterium TaxID=2528274 RepID=A0A937W2A3_UNCTE|nr:gamma-glutamyltransferase [Candidatus Tectomicrobia bacterium]